MQININSKQANLIIQCLNDKLENPEMLSDEEIEQIKNLKEEITYQDW
jgi:hypothetical protein